MQTLPIELLEFIPQLGSSSCLQGRNVQICYAVINFVTGDVRHRNNCTGESDRLGFGLSAPYQCDLDCGSGSTRKQRIGLPDRHLARSEVGYLFDNVTTAQSCLFGWAIRKYGNDHNVSKALS